MKFTVFCLAFGLMGIIACGPDNKSANTMAENTTPAPPLPEGVDSSATIKTQVLIDYLAGANIVTPNAAQGSPFAHLDYDKVIAYDFAGSEETYPQVIDQQGRFVPVVVRQKSLTQQQADNILSRLSSTSTYGDGIAACFEPHFGLVFYKGTRKINQLSVCLDCNYLISEIPIPAATEKKMNEGTSAEFALNGFSKSGRQAIIDLCRELNFRYGRSAIGIK